MRKNAIVAFIMLLAITLIAPLYLNAQMTVPIKRVERGGAAPRAIDPIGAGKEISIVNTYPLTVQQNLPRYPVVIRLGNGNFFTAWEELLSNYKSTGVGTLWAENMQSTGRSIYYTDLMPELFIGANAAVSFSDGNVLVVYFNRLDRKTRFVIFSGNMKIIKGPVLLNDGSPAEKFSATRLAGGKTALIAYFAPSGTAGGGNGKYEILNSAGEILTTGKHFSSGNRLDDVCVATLPNGVVLFAYRAGFGRSVVMDQTGNIIRAEATFYPYRVDHIEAVPLSNGNILIAFIDQNYKPRYVIIDSTGKPSALPLYMFGGGVQAVRAIGLNNGNVLLACNREVSNKCTSLGMLIVDQTGKIVKPFKWFLEGLELSTYFDMTAVKEDMALVLYGGCWPEVSGPERYKNGFLLVK